MQMATLLSKLAGFMGARLAGAAIGFVSQLVLARLFNVADVGIVLLGMSAAAFVSLAASGGYALLATTQLPKLKSHGRTALMLAFHRIALTDGLLALVVLAALAWGAAYALGFTAGQLQALLFGFACAPASSVLRYNSVIAMTERKHQLAYLPDFLIRPGLFLLGLLLAAGFGFTLSVSGILALFVTLAYVTAFVQAQLLGPERIALAKVGWPRSQLVQAVRGRALSLTIVSAVVLAFADIVTVLAGFVLPESDVAVVGISMRLAAIAGFVLQAGQTYVSADLTQAIVRRDEAATEKLLQQTNVGILVIIVAALVGALLLGDFALGLFGGIYQQGKWLLVLFLMAQSVRALGGMNQQILSINGFQLRTAGACLLALAILICAALVLCPIFGFMGIGYATVLAELAWLLALASQAQHLCGRRGDLLWVLTHR